jgi:DNA-binding MarR family transcriptional regulator
MRTNVRETSLEAHRSIHPTLAARQQSQVLAAVRAAGPAGITIAEMASTLCLEKSSVSGRRNALLTAGLIEHAPERKCRITGKFVQAVRVPSMAGEAA